jgi:hypothetical protein
VAEAVEAVVEEHLLLALAEQAIHLQLHQHKVTMVALVEFLLEIQVEVEVVLQLQDLMEQQILVVMAETVLLLHCLVLR